ncbi:MAG: PEGA domain-containing protein [Myxococcales bacterium]|nr:PEGA domain-containing protein [Myxococcales bacterium]
MLAQERLQNLLGQVHIKVSPQADVWLDGRRLGQAPGTFSIPAGRHVLELRKDGYLPARRQLTVASRREHDLSVTLKSAQRRTAALPRHLLDRPRPDCRHRRHRHLLRSAHLELE